MIDTLLLTIPEAAAELRLSRKTIERMLNRGELRAVQPNGGARRIRAEDLRAYVTGLGEPASNAASNASPRLTAIDGGLTRSQRQRAAYDAKRRRDGAL